MKPFRVKEFKSSFFTGGLPFTPDVIEIDDTYITIKKRRTPVSSLHSITIPLRNIANVKISRSYLGTNILVEAFSKNSFLGKGFSARNSREIRDILLDGRTMRG